MSGTNQRSLDPNFMARLFTHTNFRRERPADLESSQLQAGIPMEGLGSDGRAVGDASSPAIPRMVVLGRRPRPLAEVVADLANLHPGERKDIISGATIPANPLADIGTETEYVKKVNRLLAEALQHPNELTDRTLKLHILGVLSETLKVVSTIVGNLSTAAVFTTLDTSTFQGRLDGKAFYLGASLVLNTASPDLVSFVTRRLKGVETKIYAAWDPKRSNVGPYNKIGGETLLTLGQIFIYGAIASGIYDRLKKFTGVGRAAAATVPAAAGAAAAGHLVNTGLNYLTLRQQGVTTHGDLRSQRHNHDPNVGRFTALNYQASAVADRTTVKEKTIEVLLRAASVALQQGVLFGLQAANPLDPAVEPGKYQRFTVFAGFTAGLAARSLSDALTTYLYKDPARHRQRYLTIANQVRCQQLRDSSFNLRSACLNEVSNNLSGARPKPNYFKDEAAFEEYTEMRSLFESGWQAHAHRRTSQLQVPRQHRGRSAA